MCDIAIANGIKPILCSVLPSSQFGWRKELKPAKDIIALNRMIEKYANQQSIPYVDYHTPMSDEKGGLPAKYATDGVHPLDAGYEVMEEIVLPIIEKSMR